MKVLMKQLAAGPNGVRRANKILDVPEEEAQALIECGAAVSQEPEVKPNRQPKVETATSKSGERAVTR